MNLGFQFQINQSSFQEDEVKMEIPHIVMYEYFARKLLIE